MGNFVLLPSMKVEKSIRELERAKEDGGAWTGFNAFTNEIDNLKDAGIIDPLKVTKTAFVNAVSVASNYLTLGAAIVDIPKDDVLYQDLMFFEKHFNGVMPFEITIDTKKPRGILQLSTIKKIEQLQNELLKYPELSRPLSLTEVVKFSKQAPYPRFSPKS